MSWLFVLLGIAPVSALFAYMFVGYPYGNYIDKKVDDMIKEDTLMKKLEVAMTENLERIDKGDAIVYQPKKKEKHFPFKIIYRPPARWHVLIEAPYTFSYLEVVYENGQIQSVYGDTVKRQQQTEEYFALHQKRLTTIIQQLEEKESRHSNIDIGQKGTGGLKELKAFFCKEKEASYSTKKIHNHTINRFQVKFTVDETFVVLRLYYQDRLLYEIHYHQEEQEYHIVSAFPQKVTPDMWNYFQQEVVPSMKEFIKGINEKQEVDWEGKIEKSLEEQGDEKVKQTYLDLKRTYQQMNTNHQEKAQKEYRKAVEMLCRSITIRITNEGE